MMDERKKNQKKTRENKKEVATVGLVVVADESQG